jgi:hypothetical protein
MYPPEARRKLSESRCKTGHRGPAYDRSLALLQQGARKMPQTRDEWPQTITAEDPYFSRSSSDACLSYWTDNRVSSQIMGRDCAKNHPSLWQNAHSTLKRNTRNQPGSHDSRLGFISLSPTKASPSSMQSQIQAARRVARRTLSPIEWGGWTRCCPESQRRNKTRNARDIGATPTRRMREAPFSKDAGARASPEPIFGEALL